MYEKISAMNKPHLAFHAECRRGHRLMDAGDGVAGLVAEPDDNSSLPFELPTVNELRKWLESPATQDRLDELRRKIEDGSYLTREAAEQSASRMLDDDEV
jgi:hypothetical protein